MVVSSDNEGVVGRGGGHDVFKNFKMVQLS